MQVDPYEFAFTSDNAVETATPYDIIIDGTDNFPTRYLVNDVCVLLGKPNCYGSIFRFEGQASVFGLDDGPCYRCLYPQPPSPGVVPSCAEGGVLGVLPGIIGTIQATEAIKILLGIGDSLSGRLILFDALEMSFREMKVRRDPKCPICGDDPTITELVDYESFCGVPQSSTDEAAKIQPQSDWDVSPAELKSLRASGNEFVLLDVRQPFEAEICHLGGQLIPLDQLSARMDELPSEKDCHIVVHCKMGGRSSRAVGLLRDSGYTNVHNLRGGIIAWAEQIDANIAKY